MGEGTKEDASQLREVHHLLAQGRSDEAQVLLAQIAGETPASRHELTYLQAWYEVTQEHWEQVVQHVRELPVFLQKEERESLLTQGSIRRRRPICLLILGEMARETGYPEEAIEHIQHCMALLNERRMNIAEVRLLAHCSLGRLTLEMNQAAQALIQYETARSLYDADDVHPLLVEILTGLCETYTRLERFEQALTTGKQALHLLQGENTISSQEQLLLMLSRISLSLEDSASAFAYAQDARHVANHTNDPTRAAHTLLVIAEIEWKACRLLEARASCQQALALLSATQDQTLRGTTLFLLGKIAEARWHSQPGQEKSAEEALEWYEQAQAVFEARHDASSLAKVAKQLAQLLESRGQPKQALTHWKNAYILSEPRG